MTQAQKISRNGLLDALRGLAIFLVVLGHSTIGVVSSNLVTPENRPSYSLLTQALYLVHMPLFAFLMGLNMKSSWQKRPHPNYMLNRVFFFTYLYLVWTVIQGTFEVVGAKFSNNKTSVLEVLNIWHPLAHLWFLPWACLASLLILGTQPWKPRLLSWLVSGLALTLMFATWGTEGKSIPTLGMSLIFITLTGSLITSSRFLSFTQKPGILLALCTLFSSLIFAWVLTEPNSRPTSLDLNRSVDSILMGMLGTLSGTLAILCGLSLLYKKIRLTWLEKIGEYSLHIYLLHLLIVPTVRILLTKMGVLNPLLIDALATLLGVLLPLAITLICQRINFNYLFEPPFNLSTYKPKHFEEKQYV